MKKYTFLIIILFPFVLSAAPSKNENTKYSTGKKRIGLNLSPDFNYRILSAMGNAQVKPLVHSRNITEKPVIGYSIGLEYDVEISRKFLFSVGLQFSNMGFKKMYSDVSCLVSYPDSFTTCSISQQYNFKYVGVPIKLLYCSGKEKLKFLSSIGVQPQYLLQTKEITTVTEPEELKVKSKRVSNMNFVRFNFSTLIGIGAVYDVNPNIRLKAEPTFRFGLKSITETNISTFLYSVAMSFGAYYKL